MKCPLSVFLGPSSSWCEVRERSGLHFICISTKTFHFKAAVVAATGPQRRVLYSCHL